MSPIWRENILCTHEESLAQFSLPSFSQTNQVVELFLEKIKFNLIKLYLVLGYIIKKDSKL